jgi:hypothetical protein
MRFGKFLILFAAALLIAGVLAVYLSPLIVAGGLRLWAGRVARQGGLQIELGRIEAPFLGPVVIHNLHITSGPAAPFRVDAATAHLEMDLNLRAVFRASDNRLLRALRTEGISVDIRRNPQAAATPQRLAWPLLHDFLADSFKFSGVQLHVENGDTTFDLHNGELSGSELEAGTFTAREIAVTSPWFHKSFSNLRGAISWQESRLVLGALTVMPGLDVDTATVDLSQLGESRLAIEMNLDAFGGKIRARISSDDHENKRTWDIAGSGSEISLAQMSDSLEWTNRSSGSLHASKFTFRGEMNDLRNATAALWAEVTGLTWRDRIADTVMIGASLSNREVQIEQLYIKQRNNQLTLNGDFALPEKPADWLKPAFRGDISASINDLGDFARLFGWSPFDFSGAIAVQGKVSTREQKLTGQLSASGNSLILFRSPVERLEVKLGLEQSRLAISQLELRQKNDFLRGEGTFELSGDYSYSASFQTSVSEIADYAGLIPSSMERWALGGSVAAEWTGRGKSEANSGTFHVRGKSLHPLESSLIPFDAEFEGDYSPANIFFRQLHLSNQRADFSAFVGIAENYIQVQELRFSLNGRQRLQGNIFLPLAARKILEHSSWLTSLGPDPFFDVDLTLDGLDLVEFAAAVQTKPNLAGRANGQFQLSGTPGSLQGRTEFHLRDFVLDASPALTTDIDARLALGMANLKTTAVARGSEPVRIEGVIPLQIEKREAGYEFATNGPLSATFDFPAVFFRTVPRPLSGGFVDGVLNGTIVASGSLRYPRLVGNIGILEAKSASGFAVSTSARFEGETATIDYASFRQNNAAYAAHGRIDFGDLSDISLVLLAGLPTDRDKSGEPPGQAEFAFSSLDPSECIRAVELSAIPLDPASPRATEIQMRGGLLVPAWTISLRPSHAPEPLSMRNANFSQIFHSCAENEPSAKVLSIGKLEPVLD